MKKVNKDMTIAEVLKLDDSLADVFIGFGMFCIFCSAGASETVEEASMAHEIDLDLLLKKLNEVLAENEAAKANEKKGKKNQ